MIRRILFQGGGWASIGEIGAIYAIKEEMQKADSKIAPDVKLYAFSAGALTLICYSCGISKKDIFELYSQLCSVQYRENTLNPTKISFEIFKYIFKKYRNVYKKMNDNRCRIGVSRPDGFKFYNSFNSDEQLMQVTMASLHIPFISTYESMIENEPCMDGVFMFERDKFIDCEPETCLMIRTINEEEDGFSHINIDIPSIFLVIPVPAFLRERYCKTGYLRVKEYLENPIEIKPKCRSILNALSVWIMWLRNIEQPHSTFKDLMIYIKEPA